MQVVTVEGAQASACVPANDCGGNSDDGDGDDPDGGAPVSDTCGALVGPTVSAQCKSCSGATCQTNGCYGGWWCNTTSNKCQTPPTSCASTGGGGTTTLDGGPVTGTVGVNGGTVSRLLFAVAGDTRPATEDDTSGYPTSIITGIYQDIEALVPQPSFVINTGDYQFADPTGTQGAAQIDLYLTARAIFTGQTFPAMGNHECTGATISNCGSGNTNGITNNYTAFMTKMLPAGVTTPYYEVDINATDNSWTSKFLFVAANAWDSTQQSWLETAMAKTTTYTFMVRHESGTTSPGPPGEAASETIMAKYPYTLSIVGHSHTYYHGSGSREVIIGNGGAPLTSKTYGYGLIQQRSDGAIVVDMIDATTKAADSQFHFVVTPAGAATK